MKKIFYPRILFPTIKFIFAISSLTMLVYVILKIFEKSMSSLKTSVLFSAFFFIFFIGYFTFHLLYFFCFYFKYVVIKKNTISIFELKNFKITKADFDDVLGYSKSEVYFGKYTWKSKSIIIYYKSGKVSEITSSFVSNVQLLEKELNTRKVKNMGFEYYNTGWFYRKYMFAKK
ncbi:hypothetical protein [Flavobacterium polysaccharolyticum]|uniref:PH domain-containing protein n=1 Tax=Flavobacterium polysaccharolyticum TaxID=3133148 RepID=A0ABU9NKR1_9FLAO